MFLHKILKVLISLEKGNIDAMDAMKLIQKIIIKDYFKK